MASKIREPDDKADVVRFQVDPSDLLGRPGDMVSLIARELAKGRRVELSTSAESPIVPRRGPSQASLDRATDIVTVLAGGVALGGLSIAIAPASVTVAAIAGVVGAVLTYAMVKRDLGSDAG